MYAVRSGCLLKTILLFLACTFVFMTAAYGHNGLIAVYRDDVNDYCDTVLTDPYTILNLYFFYIPDEGPDNIVAIEFAVEEPPVPGFIWGAFTESPEVAIYIGDLLNGISMQFVTCQYGPPPIFIGSQLLANSVTYAAECALKVVDHPLEGDIRVATCEAGYPVVGGILGGAFVFNADCRPYLVSAAATGPKRVEAIFSEPLELTSAQEISNYEIFWQPNSIIQIPVTDANLMGDQRTVELLLEDTLMPDSNVISVSDVFKEQGHIIRPQSEMDINLLYQSYDIDLDCVALFTPVSAHAGGTIPISITVRNNGSDNSEDGWRFGAYISEDSIITKTDMLIGWFWLTFGSGIGPGASFDFNVPLMIPPGYPSGEAFIGIMLDAEDHIYESDETNNTAANFIYIGIDDDHDGVFDSADLCPDTDASYFDRNGDGCMDYGAGLRHIEYWAQGETLSYYINNGAAPGITDGSDYTAIIDAVNAWTSIPGTRMEAICMDTTSQGTASILDGVNLITFVDDEYHFHPAVLAVGIATSFTEPTYFNGRLYRSGQIVDADVIFNPNKKLTTPSTGGEGVDIGSIATHEVGHLFGLSHTAVKSSTMFFVLPTGTEAASLETDDRTAFFKAYWDSLTVGNRIGGIVRDGLTNDPVPGAIVFAMDSLTGDTAGCEITMADGSYLFNGLPDGIYCLSIYPLNGSSAIGYLQPPYVNWMVDSLAVTDFVPEYWNYGESSQDDPLDMGGTYCYGGAVWHDRDFLTNADVTPPEVMAVTPGDGEVDVPIDAAVLISFSEPIDVTTIQGNFSLKDSITGAGIGGNAAIFNDDMLVSFTPSESFSFSSIYELTLGTGLEDKFGNGLAATYSVVFKTEDKPPLAITSLSPSKGVVGCVVIISGDGFSTLPQDNTVRFEGTIAEVNSASPSQLVVTVPAGATTGLVNVEVGPFTSNDLTFTLLSETEIARGFESGLVGLGSIPRSLTVLPDGSYAYVATEAGASAVVVDPDLPGHLSSIAITIPGGLDELDVTPDGKRVYGVNTHNGFIHVIDSDPADTLLFNTILATIPTDAEPLGIVVEPGGRRAYIPTWEGDIQVWDVQQGSATYQNQVGLISSPDPNIRGKMAIDPAGDLLLALSGAGKLLVFVLGTNSLLAEIPVGADPKDVVVDPTGQYAYVSDGSGFSSVVLLSGLYKVQDIVTGGSLRGLTVTPAGLYLYAINRELNLLDVIDLNDANATYRSVVSTIAVGTNPVDIELSPDGFYSYSLIEGERNLVVTKIGLGPSLKSLSRVAGPVSAKLVLAGEGFPGDPDSCRVIFSATGGGSTEVIPERSTRTALTVTVPGNAASGAVSVTVDMPDGPEPSNAIYFDVLGPTPSPGQLRPPTKTRPGADIYLTRAIARSPTGELTLIGGEGTLLFLDTDPNSPSFNQVIENLSIGVGTDSVYSIVLTPDGKRAYVTVPNASNAYVVDSNRHSGTFAQVIGTVNPLPHLAAYWALPMEAAMSPDGEVCLIHAHTGSHIHLVDIIPGSVNENMAIDTVYVPSITDIEYHPGGEYAYVTSFTTGSVYVIDMRRDGGTFFRPVSSVNFGPYRPLSLSFDPSGYSCYVLAEGSADGYAHVNTLDTSDPVNPTWPSTQMVGTAAANPLRGDRIDVSPRGDRAVVHTVFDGLFNLDITTSPYPELNVFDSYVELGEMDQDFSVDGSRIYAVGGSYDSLLVYEFGEADSLLKISGDAQEGIVNKMLPAPLRVRVKHQLGDPVSGVAVTFNVISGEGYFEDNNAQTRIVSTDLEGYADVDWRLGGVLGAQEVEASAYGLVGSPVHFTANALLDPATLPLNLAEVIPLDSTMNVSVTTAIKATFSRGVKQSSVNETTFYLHRSGEASPVPAVKGFSDNNRKLSLSPLAPLDFGTEYTIEVTAGLTDEDNGPLENPDQSVFTTQSPPPPTLASISPPSATVNTPVVISGTGFSTVAVNNTVLFNNVETKPSNSSVDFMEVEVPLYAVTGSVRVAVGADTSNSLPFTVLEAKSSAADEVVATVGTGSATKSVAITPDGALAYTVSPDADLVIPIDIKSESSLPGIPVGDNPVAIDIHPEGTFAYIANFGSGSVSIIDINSNEVVQTLLVGSNPIDLVVSSDGDRIYVANAGSSDIGVVDGDSESETHHQVLASVGTGATTKSVAITPDGSLLYIGTDTGYIIMDTSDYNVIASVGVGSSTKSVAITPDGALLVLLTTEGEVLIVDIQTGSITENNVIASVGAGSTTKSVAISPDGALLYLVQDDADVVIVVSIEVLSSVSVIEQGTSIPPTIIHVAIIDTVEVGENPAGISFDPSGSGLVLVTNAGDETVDFLSSEGGPVTPLEADVVVTPRTLNLQSRGRWITGTIELGSGYAPEEIDIESVFLQEVIPAVQDKWEIGDEDLDGIMELVVKFDRAIFQSVMPQGEYVPVEIKGIARDREFIGRDTIRTIRPTVNFPKGGVIPQSENVTVKWTTPEGYQVYAVDIHWTPNDGEIWYPVATGIADEGSALWQTPEAPHDSCRVMVTLYADENMDLGMGMSQDMFLITEAVSVMLQSFEGSLESGAVVLRWSTAAELGVEGFHILRSENADKGFKRITEEVITPKGGTGGSSYEFIDSGVRPNRTYYYELEVCDWGLGQIHGPCEVIYLVSFSLEQNVPNPFNPNTMIRFTIPEEVHANLTIYDVAGRRVRTLVNELLRADNYEVVWNGKNNNGNLVSSGIYFYRLEAGKNSQTRKMMLLR